jgi:hypothetical protein
MAGYCNDLPWSFWLVYAASEAQWQVWQLFSKLRQRKSKKSKGNGRRIGITIEVTCHTCHAFSVFGLGTPFGTIATCHRTCHGFAIAEKAA